jgi:predicted neutral ceramidase superfamily lipid hydrolase
MKIHLLNFGLSVLAVSVSRDNTALYIIGVLCVLLAKLALLWDGDKKLSTKSVIISIVLSLSGGYLGFLIGLVLVPDKELLRLVILLVFIYIGDVILATVKSEAPIFVKSILNSGVKAIQKKLGDNPSEKVKENQNENEEN